MSLLTTINLKWSPTNNLDIIENNLQSAKEDGDSHNNENNASKRKKPSLRIKKNHPIENNIGWRNHDTKKIIRSMIGSLLYLTANHPDITFL